LNNHARLYAHTCKLTHMEPGQRSCYTDGATGWKIDLSLFDSRQ